MMQSIQTRHASRISRSARRRLHVTDMHAAIRGSSGKICSAGAGWQGAPQGAETIDLLFDGWLRHAPIGWQGLMTRMVRRLTAVLALVEPENGQAWCPEMPSRAIGADAALRSVPAMTNGAGRRQALFLMTLNTSSAQLRFSFAQGADPVLIGILRKAQMASRHTCMECGMPGRERHPAVHDQHLQRANDPASETTTNSRTLCARCSAPLMLRDNLFLLQHSIAHLRQQDGPATLLDVPPLLHPSFLKAATNLRLNGPSRMSNEEAVRLEWIEGEDVDHQRSTRAEMGCEEFLNWAEVWMNAGRKLRLIDCPARG